MSKLREKLKKAVTCTPIGVNAIVYECEQITDDFSIKFAEWIGKEIKMFDDNSGYLKTEDRFLSTTELQQYFKNNIYDR